MPGTFLKNWHVLCKLSSVTSPSKNPTPRQEKNIKYKLQKKYLNKNEWKFNFSVARMENWNHDLPERYSKFCGLYIKFQGHGKLPWTW